MDRTTLRVGRARAWAAGAFLGGLLIGAASSSYYYLRSHSEEEGIPFTELRSEGYIYTRPLLECEIHQGNAVKEEIRSFRGEISEKVTDMISEGEASEVSLYYRDLDNGPWFSINPESTFIPASLMKVEAMISIFKMAERDPRILKMETVVDGNTPRDWGQTYAPAEQLQVGRVYNVEELLDRMIRYSDNGATALLNTLIPKGFDKQIFKDLGVVMKRGEGGKDVLTVESMATFFRVLYNASYLSRDYSEKTLSILSESMFRGLKKGVPKDVDVAEKFGHFRLTGAEAQEQLHACGIVYHTDHPYLLCIMTRGKDLKSLEKVIASLSSEVYGHVNSNDFRIR